MRLEEFDVTGVDFDDPESKGAPELPFTPEDAKNFGTRIRIYYDGTRLMEMWRKDVGGISTIIEVGFRKKKKSRMVREKFRSYKEVPDEPIVPKDEAHHQPQYYHEQQGHIWWDDVPPKDDEK